MTPLTPLPKVTYHLQTGNGIGSYPGFRSLRSAIIAAYDEARQWDEVVTLFAARGPKSNLVFEALCVFSPPEKTP